ncbi:class II fructose-bisphosphate aldolase [uncultured Desulfobulbus sp.]|uniref:class II fructose-bisphosphate aldolase n=1 Tax=uncultured Desulfobulbus sp. TaxID=239745 RepID=UPI0029C828A7|nr:class II fructose-bisphosphate aldolase [uncultured Desulfobulbus sp.]
MTVRRSDKLAKTVAAAASSGIVIPAFNAPYLPMVEAITTALAKYDAFGMVEVARLEFTKFEAGSIPEIYALFEKYADKRVTTLHLDHTPVIDEDGLIVDWKQHISDAIAAGYDSVMIDGSRLSLDENIAVAKQVVELAHPSGVLVEAELGSVMGHEDGPLPPYDELFASKAGFTKPEEARRFVQETGVDWLSVSIGSIHGAIAPSVKDKVKMTAKLDIERLKELRDATGIPLVLHGGSGVAQSYIDEAIKNGMFKINIGTDIRQPYERALAAGGSIEDAQSAVVEKMGELICDVFHIKGSATTLGNLI